MDLTFDHVVVGCDALETGVPVLEARLGVPLPQGGQHQLMGTHNHVLPLAQRCYLELIARDPGSAPARPRWFSLDDPKTVAHLAQAPRALCWAVATTDLDAVLAKSPVDLGEAVPMSRNGLHWRVSVPRDGHLPEGGLLPFFIEWGAGTPHPADRAERPEIALDAVALTHPDPDRLSRLLSDLGVAGMARVSRGAPGLAFDLTTPNGPVRLD